MTETAGGLELQRHRSDLEPIIKQIIVEHTKRKGCAWNDDAVDNILRGWGEVVESQELCRSHSRD